MPKTPRYREQIDPLVSTLPIRSFSIEPGEGEPEWNLVSEIPCLHRIIQHSESRMNDAKCWGKFQYHDCDHEKLNADYGQINYELMHRDPYYTSINPGGMKYEIPAGKVVEDCLFLRGASLNTPYPVRRVLPWLSDSILPTIITLDRAPFESDFSIWFLVADFVQLPKLVAQIFGRQIIRRHELAGPRTFKQLADDDLMTKFGILATYRDLVDFVGICKRFMRGFEEYVKADKVYRWHGRDDNVLSLVPETREVELIYNTLGHGIHHVKVVHNMVSCKHSRTMAYRITCPELKSWLSRFKQLIDLFGVLDPAAIWDLIPFSFIVDWFYDIGGWLHDNKPRLFKGAVVVKDYCESIRIHHNTTWYAKPNTLDGPVYSDIGEEQHITYVRRRYQPDVNKFAQKDSHPMLSIRQAIVAAGLVAQRLPRPGSIGDWFEGVDFGRDHLPVNGTTSEVEHKANKAWADQQRQRKAALASGIYPALRKFEMTRSQIVEANRHDVAIRLRLPRSSAVHWINMRHKNRRDYQGS